MSDDVYYKKKVVQSSIILTILINSRIHKVEYINNIFLSAHLVFYIKDYN
jgi:hypothetical protein